MESNRSLFERWPTMARDLGYSRQRVHAWKKARQIPAGEEQRKVLEVGCRLGLGLLPEDVIFPFPEDRQAAR